MRKFSAQFVAAILIAAFALAGLVFLSGCASSRRVQFSPPSTAMVQASVTSAQESVTEAGQEATATGDALTRAQAHADDLFRAAPPDLRPLVIALQADLKDAQTHNAAVTAQLATTQGHLADATDQVTTLQGKVDLQTSALNQATNDKNAALTKLAKDDKALSWYRWHWWGSWIVFALGVIAAGIFAFLKFSGRLALAVAPVAAKI
ncbi:MAG: hypothetical protein ABSE62_10360 [Chthoniobacteraceae bacterium]|jgi:hypothetical protein